MGTWGLIACWEPLQISSPASVPVLTPYTTAGCLINDESCELLLPPVQYRLCQICRSTDDAETRPRGPWCHDSPQLGLDTSASQAAVLTAH